VVLPEFRLRVTIMPVELILVSFWFKFRKVKKKGLKEKKIIFPYSEFKHILKQYGIIFAGFDVNLVKL